MPYRDGSATASEIGWNEYLADVITLAEQMGRDRPLSPPELDAAEHLYDAGTDYEVVAQYAFDYTLSHYADLTAYAERVMLTCRSLHREPMMLGASERDAANLAIAAAFHRGVEPQFMAHSIARMIDSAVYGCAR